MKRTLALHIALLLAPLTVLHSAIFRRKTNSGRRCHS